MTTATTARSASEELACDPKASRHDRRKLVARRDGPVTLWLATPAAAFVYAAVT
jgi:hypothetical protein